MKDKTTRSAAETKRLASERSKAGKKGRGTRAVKERKREEEMLVYGYLSVTEAATKLEVSYPTANRWAHSGKVKTLALGSEHRLFIELNSLIAHVGPHDGVRAGLYDLLKFKKKEWSEALGDIKKAKGKGKAKESPSPETNEDGF